MVATCDAAGKGADDSNADDLTVSCGDALGESDILVATSAENCKEIANILTAAGTEFNGPAGDDANQLTCFGSILVASEDVEAGKTCASSVGLLNNVLEAWTRGRLCCGGGWRGRLRGGGGWRSGRRGSLALSEQAFLDSKRNKRDES